MQCDVADAVFAGWAVENANQPEPIAGIPVPTIYTVEVVRDGDSVHLVGFFDTNPTGRPSPVRVAWRHRPDWTQGGVDALRTLITTIQVYR